MSNQSHSFEPRDRHTQTVRRVSKIFSYYNRRSLILSFRVLRRWGQCPRPVQSSLGQIGKVDNSSKCNSTAFWCKMCVLLYSRILIQQSEKFIFNVILVLGLHQASDYACGVWTYNLPFRPTTPEAVYTSHKTATELDINLTPYYWLGWFHILRFYMARTSC